MRRDTHYHSSSMFSHSLAAARPEAVPQATLDSAIPMVDSALAMSYGTPSQNRHGDQTGPHPDCPDTRAPWDPFVFDSRPPLANYPTTSNGNGGGGHHSQQQQQQQPYPIHHPQLYPQHQEGQYHHYLHCSQPGPYHHHSRAAYHAVAPSASSDYTLHPSHNRPSFDGAATRPPSLPSPASSLLMYPGTASLQYAQGQAPPHHHHDPYDPAKQFPQQPFHAPDLWIPPHPGQQYIQEQHLQQPLHYTSIPPVEQHGLLAEFQCPNTSAQAPSYGSFHAAVEHQPQHHAIPVDYRTNQQDAETSRKPNGWTLGPTLSSSPLTVGEAALPPSTPSADSAWTPNSPDDGNSSTVATGTSRASRTRRKWERLPNGGGPGFETRQILRVLSLDHQTEFQVQVHGRMNKGFHRSEESSEIICYKRNYSKITSCFTAIPIGANNSTSNTPATATSLPTAVPKARRTGSAQGLEQGLDLPCLIDPTGNGHWLECREFLILPVAICDTTSTFVKLNQRDTKRDNGPSVEVAMKSCPPNGKLDPRTKHDLARMAQWERVQFSRSTPKGRARAASSRARLNENGSFHVELRLIARCTRATVTGGKEADSVGSMGEEQYVVAVAKSEPVVVRGRCPKYYEQDRHAARTTASTRNSGPGDGDEDGSVEADESGSHASLASASNPRAAEATTSTREYLGRFRSTTSRISRRKQPAASRASVGQQQQGETRSGASESCTVRLEDNHAHVGTWLPPSSIPGGRSPTQESQQPQPAPMLVAGDSEDRHVMPPELSAMLDFPDAHQTSLPPQLQHQHTAAAPVYSVDAHRQ